MGSDLSDILLLILAGVGLVVLLDVLILKPARNKKGTATEPIAVEYARQLFPVLLIVVLLRSFLFESFRIPSASMMPGLVDGDFIFVSKLAYGLRLPLLHKKLIPTWEPQRGDVVVFRSTSGPPINLIKRLVGLPGDHVTVHANRLTINGKLIPLSPDGYYDGGLGFTGAELDRERLGSGDHVVMLAAGLPATDFDAVVPAGHYFFMGDNRNDSEDSRFARVGFVPEDHLIGRALRIWLNWRLPDRPQLGRIGRAIR